MAFKWTEEMVNTLTQAATQYEGTEMPYETAEELAGELKVSTRSVGAKLRALGYKLAKKASEVAPKWSDAEADALSQYIAAGYNDEQIAEMMGKTTRQIRGKALNMGLVSKLLIVKKEKTETPKVFTEEQANVLTEMVAAGKYLEEMAEALGKTVSQIRGKLLSMKLKAPQRDHKDTAAKKVYTDEVKAEVVKLVNAGQTAEAIADKLGLNLVGLKSFIGKQGLKTSDMAQKVTKKYSDEDIELLKEYAEAGKTLDEAAEALGRTIQSVRVVAGKNKISFKKDED